MRVGDVAEKKVACVAEIKKICIAGIALKNEGF
jgi:hypothetical protein